MKQNKKNIGLESTQDEQCTRGGTASTSLVNLQMNRLLATIMPDSIPLYRKPLMQLSSSTACDTSSCSVSPKCELT